MAGNVGVVVETVNVHTAETGNGVREPLHEAEDENKAPLREMEGGRNRGNGHI